MVHIKQHYRKPSKQPKISPQINLARKNVSADTTITSLYMKKLPHLQSFKKQSQLESYMSAFPLGWLLNSCSNGLSVF